MWVSCLRKYRLVTAFTFLLEMAVVTQPVYVSERDINPHVLLSKSEKEKVVEFSLPDFIMAHKIWRKLVTWSPNTMPSEWPWFGPSAFSNTYGLEMTSPPPAWGTPRHTTGKWIVGGELLQNGNTVGGVGASVIAGPFFGLIHFPVKPFCESSIWPKQNVSFTKQQ